MWSRKRLLKKEKKQYTKKRILLLSFLSGGFGVILIGIGYIVLTQEPVFMSPLPLFSAFGGSDDKDISKETIIQYLKNQQISYSHLKQPGKTIYQVTLVNNGDVFLTTEKDIPEQLASLQRIVSRLTMEGKKFSRLDLRYDKPIIVLE